MPTHIKAKPNEVAETVLLPGNPDRAKYIAEEYLENPTLYTEYRRMFGYTGTYKGNKVSVQTTGMGVPSLGIILEELNMLGAKKLIRVGTSGTLADHIEFSDLIIAISAATVGPTINVMDTGYRNVILSPCADFELTQNLHNQAKQQNIPVHVGQVSTGDYFYGTPEKNMKQLAEHGVLAGEMETAGLFHIAAKHDMRAASILTASDHILENKKRANKNKIKKGVDRMTKVVLNSINNKK